MPSHRPLRRLTPAERRFLIDLSSVLPSSTVPAPVVALLGDEAARRRCAPFVQALRDSVRDEDTPAVTGAMLPVLPC
jgi:hypothetical protein